MYKVVKHRQLADQIPYKVSGEDVQHTLISRDMNEFSLCKLCFGKVDTGGGAQ